MYKKEKVLVTGCSGFIGMHLCISLLKEDYQVMGLDNMNDYYDVQLKKDRLKNLTNFKNFQFEKIDISDSKTLNSIFSSYKPEKVVNLAAQAGVRHSLEKPREYISSNISGFMNILECVRHNRVKCLVYASSSSVYGNNKKTPFSVFDTVNKPSSIYGVTKRTNELMAQTYSHLYNIKTTGLRFFTVYGPWGRPDMAMYTFTDKIIQNKEIEVYNNGDMYRDFTYIDDIINGIRASLEKGYTSEIFNLGNNKSEKLTDLIKIIENKLERKAKIKFSDIPLGDIKKTYSDIAYSQKKLGFNPSTSILNGVPRFIDWFIDYKKNR